MNDLQIGAAIIKEALEREVVKEERAQRRKEEEKAAQDAAKAKVLFDDDLLRMLLILYLRSSKRFMMTGKAGPLLTNENEWHARRRQRNVPQEACRLNLNLRTTVLDACQVLGTRFPAMSLTSTKGRTKRMLPPAMMMTMTNRWICPSRSAWTVLLIQMFL